MTKLTTKYWNAFPIKAREVAQSCLTLCDPMDCNLPGSSVHGIFQVRILEWVAISSSKGSSQPRDQTCLSLRLLHWQLDSLLSEPFCLVSDSKLFSKESWSSSFFFPSVSAKLTSLRRYLLSSQSLTGTISDWLHHVQGGHVEWITCLHCPWLVYLLRGG